MGKPDWKYNPMRDGGVSIAAQEDSARETQAQRDKDVVYARDYAAIVECLRIDYQKRAARAYVTDPAVSVADRMCRVVRFPNDVLSEDVGYLTFVDQWGFPSLLRALAKAIELEAK